MLKTHPKKSVVKMPTLKQDATIRAAALADPSAPLLSDEQLTAMVPLRSLRGRPKAATTKILLSVRYSTDVVTYFKSTGPGWQSRMDAVLRRWVAKRST